MITFQPASAKTIIFITPNDAPGTQTPQIPNDAHFPKWGRPGLLRPWVLHAPGAIMTVVELTCPIGAEMVRPQETSNVRFVVRIEVRVPLKVQNEVF